MFNIPFLWNVLIILYGSKDTMFQTWMQGEKDVSPEATVNSNDLLNEYT